MTAGSGRKAALRRYPAMGFLVVAAVLATLLPSALNVPLSGPSSLAELAPVPPDGESADQAGDLSDLGQADSGGLGVGNGAGGGGTGAGAEPEQPAPDPSLAQRRPRSKRCVGSPPRQTEDPLSPPCVAFFDGDNGGATHRGVTKDEVRIVLHLGARTTPLLIDYAQPAGPDETGQNATFGVAVRAYQRFFNDRYQTYGRFAHFYGYSGPISPEELRAGVRDIVTRVNPFAVVYAGGGTGDPPFVMKEAARQGLVTFYWGGYDRADARALAPLLLSFAPDLQSQAELAATHICARYAGRVARHSGNLDDRAKPRVFGLVFQEDAEKPEWARLADLLAAELSRGCNLRDLPRAFARTTNEGQGDYAQNVAAMRAAGVTTVIPIAASTGMLGWGPAAEAVKWYPEWVIPGVSEPLGMDQNASARQYPPLVWRNAFGLMFDLARGAASAQPFYQAAKEACPSCDFAQRDTRMIRLYDVLTLAFWGVQAAGPRLTPANLDKGLHAIPQRASHDASTPTAYFAPGNYSWIKDATGISWDPTGGEPGGVAPGCYRLVDEGRRFRAGEWPSGDEGAKRTDVTCQGPTR